MTSTGPLVADGSGNTPPNETPITTDDRPKVIFEFGVSADGFALGQTLREVPDLIVEFEQLVPTLPNLLPYLWISDGDQATFEEAAANDPTVENCQRIAALDGGILYEFEWADGQNSVLEWVQTKNQPVLEAYGHDSEWVIKLRVESRRLIDDFRTYCDDHDIDFRLIRAYDLVSPKMGQYNISEKQIEALTRAYEMGHFNIPREATLSDVAAALGISPKATSERLRRGQTNLISNTLTIGHPTGIGVDSE